MQSNPWAAWIAGKSDPNGGACVSQVSPGSPGALQIGAPHGYDFGCDSCHYE